ncbi:hypothetical protein [Micromonospora sp. KLBMP9576]|uniref:hypothetical protein n=1 Tax=Micromonospora sp. KLBMP9576 TaxID=3424769 RepID=UPI003D8D3700
MTQRTGAAGRVGRGATVAAALLAVTAMVAGCGGDGPDGTPTQAAPSVSPPPSPKDTLLAAVPTEEDPAFRFSGSDLSGAVTGVVDPAGKALELTVTEKDEELDFTMKLTFRLIEQRSWMKVSFAGEQDLSTLLKLPKRWMELDPTKIKDPAGVPSYEGADPGNTGAIIQAAQTVTEAGGGKYTGTVDLTDDPNVAEALEGVDVPGLGDAAKQVPFTAAVGPDGNLASLTVNIPAAGKQKATKYVVKYSNFGNTPQLTAPTGTQVQKAPASAYEMLNG